MSLVFFMKINLPKLPNFNSQITPHKLADLSLKLGIKLAIIFAAAGVGYHLKIYDGVWEDLKAHQDSQQVLGVVTVPDSTFGAIASELTAETLAVFTKPPEASGSALGVASTSAKLTNASLTTTGEVAPTETDPTTSDPLLGDDVLAAEVAEEDELEAWWSVVEYSERLEATITAFEPIECSFVITYLGENKSVMSKKINDDMETCTFEVKLKGDHHLLWGEAISDDGRKRSFGNL